MVDLCERFGRYGMYSQENVESEIGQGLGQRHDSVLELHQDRRALRPPRRPQDPRPAHQLLPRGVRLRPAHADRRHRAVPQPRRVRRRGARRARPADRRAGDRVRQPDGAGPGTGHPHRRARVPRRQPQSDAAVAARGHAPLRPVRAVAHADRNRRRLVPRLRRRRVRVLPRRRRRRRPSPIKCAATPRWSSTPTRCSTASTASRRRARTCRRSSPACTSRSWATGQWAVLGGDERGRALPRGTSCASRCRGRRTASPTRRSATRGATGGDDLSPRRRARTSSSPTCAAANASSVRSRAERARADDHRRVHRLPRAASA